MRCREVLISPWIFAILRPFALESSAKCVFLRLSALTSKSSSKPMSSKEASMESAADVSDSTMRRVLPSNCAGGADADSLRCCGVCGDPLQGLKPATWPEAPPLPAGGLHGDVALAAGGLMVSGSLPSLALKQARQRPKRTMKQDAKASKDL